MQPCVRTGYRWPAAHYSSMITTLTRLKVGRTLLHGPPQLWTSTTAAGGVGMRVLRYACRHGGHTAAPALVLDPTVQLTQAQVPTAVAYGADTAAPTFQSLARQVLRANQVLSRLHDMLQGRRCCCHVALAVRGCLRAARWGVGARARSGFACAAPRQDMATGSCMRSHTRRLSKSRTYTKFTCKTLVCLVARLLAAGRGQSCVRRGRSHR